MQIKLLGHASVKIKSKTGAVLYFDPYKISDDEKADLILISHDHFDHNSPSDVEALQKEDTIIITTQAAAKTHTGSIKTVKPGDKISIGNIKVEAVHAYNIGKKFHPKGMGIGFVVTVEGKRIYFAGDTDKIPEMSNLENIDVAFLPIGGTYTMNAEEAAQALHEINAKVCIPVHYGSVVGTKKDAEIFKQKCEELGLDTEIRVI
ncbi:MBL fold metallo-hydrolase [Candidatus Woesearchaeota archaeon]|nr:MBL fold metallo-hydrolase [Candidatus Woesearchaeota archaeon]